VTRKNIKKIDIAKNLSSKIGYPLNFSKKIINDLVEIIIMNIKKGDFNLKNIGTFKLIEKKEREGRNPMTGERFIISERKTVVFNSSKNMNKKF
jgi:nucleoid DNA-binding protein